MFLGGVGEAFSTSLLNYYLDLSLRMPRPYNDLT